MRPDRMEGVIGEVFVVDRVELVALDEAWEMGELGCEQTVFSEENAHALDKVVQIRNVGEDVIGDQEVGAPALPAEVLGETPP